MTIPQIIKKRNGDVVPFDVNKIEKVIKKAFLAARLDENEPIAKSIAGLVSSELEFKMLANEGVSLNVEQIQDIVERHLMSAGFFDVAKKYIIYRYEHEKIREQEKFKAIEKLEEGALYVLKRNGKKQKFDIEKVRKSLGYVLSTLSDEEKKLFETEVVLNQVKLEVFDNMSTKDVGKVLLMNIRSMIELDPVYSKVGATLLLSKLYKQVLGDSVDFGNIKNEMKKFYPKYIQKMVELKKFDQRMLDFDLEKLADYLVLERDHNFEYMGLEILSSRYLIEDSETGLPLETPQMFWMRIAMGTAIIEDKDKKETVAKDFYDILSEFYYTPGGRTLFQSGTIKAQLSNCFVNIVPDDLREIFRMYSDNAQLLKWSGGVGTSWSKVRGTGAQVKSVDIHSQGVVPYLKIANDINVCVMRSGKRRAASVVYLETWHVDIEDFLELRKNTGDERRRTHDLNTSNWIPDLFMERVKEDKEWTLFSPDETPDLPDLYGKAFAVRYEEYEKMSKDGKIKLFKVIKAKDLWKKMIGMLFETGHPWICFKDPSNIRSPQDHVGVIHSSNLCTEIMLNTSDHETAVCNLGSINLAKFVTKHKTIDKELLQKVVRSSVRMIDNTVDINYYPTEDSKASNMKHRPIGLGIRGYHDALYGMNILFDTNEAVDFADESMELISYYTILSSSELAKEKGKYDSYEGSKWSKGILPQDTVALLEKERGSVIDIPKGGKLDWTPVRNHIKQYGMRNSNTMAIAPTASTANLVGCIPTVEPIYKNIYVKSNKEGEFIVVNKYLVEDLKKINLWNRDMVNKIKFYDGSIQEIHEIPQDIKEKHKEVFDINQKWLILAAARRGKWIDQAQSINIFFKGSSGKELSDVYMMAYDLGLKTTYYLRTLGASQVEKSTVNTSEFGSTHLRDSKSSTVAPASQADLPSSFTSTSSTSTSASSTITTNRIVDVGVESTSSVQAVEGMKIERTAKYVIYRPEQMEECEGCSA
ncbi:MAG: ribonucleoside-diphosphate reductase subunit alpha [Candidatus Pacebacteria bacterium]|nr:ribonucleoside-diphosphate reductase subunit alpha [Candidatus Paceibacterota bacterium]MBP9867155.1 ribonucleoside-diphosphate reductase subunit alpha [Candidatus Paceibacterota bacterium]